MVTTQSFRLHGKPDIKDIICDQVDGENVVFWEDIEQVFPGVKYVTNGNTVISMMRDSNRKRIVPQCIKHYPGVILDVALLTTISDTPFESFTATSSVSYTEGRPRVLTTQDLEPEIMQRLASFLGPKTRVQLQSASNGYDTIARSIEDGQVNPMDLVKRCIRELKTEMTKNMELSARVVELIEKKQPQTPSLDQMPLLRKRIQAFLARNYELHEYSIPRLFVVFPPSWDPLGSPSNTFRLYFLCECGEHTKSTNAKTSQHIHLAKHGGYDIIDPKEFFQQYGSYVLTIHQMLKFGISEAGITVPSLSRLINTDGIDRSALDMQLLADIIESGMDLTIGYIEKTSADKGQAVDVFTEQMANNEASGYPDLHHLETFLKKDQNRVLGNLYRTITAEGHVKWVCVDHYYANYQEKAVKAFRDTVESLKGSFDVNTGRVKVSLDSRDKADAFLVALEKAKSAYELNICLIWNTNHGDFKILRDILASTNISVLELDLTFVWYGLDSDSSNHIPPFDFIFDIMRRPSLKSVTIIGPPKGFIKHSSLLSRSEGFPNLRHLSIDIWDWGFNSHDLEGLIAKAANLSDLTLTDDYGSFIDAYNAIARCQTFSINFPDRQIRILPPTNKPQQSMAELQDMAQFLEHLGERIEILDLSGDGMDRSTIAALAKSTKDGSKLKELALCAINRLLDEQCIRELAGIVARSKLRKLDIHLENDGERMQILEAVQWGHINTLVIRMNERDLGLRPLRTLVQGIEKLSGRAQLDHFELYHTLPRRSMSIAQEQLLQSFLASTILKHLHLEVLLTFEQLISVIGSFNVSRLQHLFILCEGFKSTEVDAILDKLQQATELLTVTLSGAEITDEHSERLKTKGITLTM